MVETRAFSQEGEDLDWGLVLPVEFAQVWIHQPTNWIKTLNILIEFPMTKITQNSIYLAPYMYKLWDQLHKVLLIEKN
jgi:hypothetical protein